MKLINTISSIVIAFVFIYALTFKSLVTFNYFINQSEIIALFCINKEKPRLNCNGKCHLSKELVKTENKNSKFPFSSNNHETSLEFIFDIEHDKVQPLIPLKNTKYSYEHSHLILTKSMEIPTPPPKA